MNETVVIFRKWKEDGKIIALFPEIASDRQGIYCLSYERVGQHGGADYCGVIEKTKPAKRDEYTALKRELEGRGYKLKIADKSSRRMHARRSCTQ